MAVPFLLLTILLALFFDANFCVEESSANSTRGFVQVRALLQQPTRAFLLQHKGALSPQQQNQILDDIRKTQRLESQSNSVSSDISNATPNAARSRSLFNDDIFNIPSTSFSDFLFPPPPSVGYGENPKIYESPSRGIFDAGNNSKKNANRNSIYSQFEPLKTRLTTTSAPKFRDSIPIHRFGPSDSKPQQIPNKQTNNNYQKWNNNNNKQNFERNDNINYNNLFRPTIASDKITTISKPYPTENNKMYKEIYVRSSSEDLSPNNGQKYYIPEDLTSNKGQKYYTNPIANGVKNPDSREDNDFIISSLAGSGKSGNIREQEFANIKSQFESELLRQLGADSATLRNTGNNSISEISLPDGQKIQISRDYSKLLAGEEDQASKIKAVVIKTPTTARTTTTNDPPANILEQLKEVVPAGSNYELIRAGNDGRLEPVSKFPVPQKKVTFVILEEQPDGSVKVQGVKGDTENVKNSGEVNSIIQKIKDGKIKLPESSKKIKNSVSSSTNKHNVKSPSKTSTTKATTISKDDNNLIDLLNFKNSPALNFSSIDPSSFFKTLSKYQAQSEISSLESFEESSERPVYRFPLAPTKSDIVYKSSTHRSTYMPTLKTDQTAAQSNFNNFADTNEDESSVANFLNNIKYDVNTMKSDVNTIKYDVNTIKYDINTIKYDVNTIKHEATTASKYYTPTKLPSTTQFADGSEEITVKSNPYKPSLDYSQEDNVENESNNAFETTSANVTLSDRLKHEGFYAMAKFLKQSGLDTILNDTGPFTLFVPSDKAFRTLLIQLGGPDKAQEKFKENPRLLSGLLLHHVIPGAFRVSSLQDEMTGVSLAGTQLRVNTYTTHDIEWNDVKVTTINGARILDEQDIVIPQGIAHSIDRVMFPLPIGNIVQTLRADRENRYSNFLRILEESAMTETLSGSKTYTVFAPLNKAFTSNQFSTYISTPEEAASFISRHVVPGPLFSAGMKYYQVRDSIQEGQQITVYKEAGRIKVNSAHVVTRNIPATNGVIHAIDNLL